MRYYLKSKRRKMNQRRRRNIISNESFRTKIKKLSAWIVDTTCQVMTRRKISLSKNESEELLLTMDKSKDKIESEVACSKNKSTRRVFNVNEEESFLQDPEIIHYLRASSLFYQNVEKINSEELPRKLFLEPWSSLESVVYVHNPDIEMAFETLKEKFKSEGKVDKYGNVSETLLFHGTTNESLNLIIEQNFSLEHRPALRKKLMLFGTGIYFSELPGVSLMYGEKLLLCKVILGKVQFYKPDGSTPPEIPEDFDSRVILRDGLEVVTVVKNPDQIVPYCAIVIKEGRIQQTAKVPQTNNSNTTSSSNSTSTSITSGP